MGRGYLYQSVVDLLNQFRRTLDAETCSAPVADDVRARTLLDIACELATSRRFSSVLTPNYNEGHRNHFHLEVSGAAYFLVR